MLNKDDKTWRSMLNKDDKTWRSMLNKDDETWRSMLNKDNKVGVFFMDFSKVFDTLNQNLLLYELKAYGLNTNTL